MMPQRTVPNTSHQWARAAFGDLAGFLVAWNLWIYAMVLMSEIGLTTVTNLAYAIAARGGIVVSAGHMSAPILERLGFMRIGGETLI